MEAPPRPKSAPARFGLSPREREVMAYVAAHYRSKAIARLIGTQPKTVDAQIASACRKLGARDRAEAVRLLLGDPTLREKPASASSPISMASAAAVALAAEEDLSDVARSGGEVGGFGSPFAVDDLQGSERSTDAGRFGPRAPGDGPISDIGTAGAVSVPDWAPNHVRDSAVRELPGGRRPSISARRLDLADGGMRLLWAAVLALGLALALPLALKAVIALQKIVHSLQLV
jgi:DNA-binding CsgD family transcriptional regulator